MTNRLAAALGLLLLTVAGCGQSAPSSGSSTDASASPSPTPSASASVTPPAPTTPAGSIRVGPVTLVPPAGWQVIRDIPYPGKGPFDLCLAPKGASPYVSGCAGVLVYWGADIPGAEMSTYQPNQADGWYHASDVEPCPIGRKSTEGDLNGIKTGGAPVEDGLRPVGLHQASYDRWKVSCDDGSTFTPEAWYLPKTGLLVQDFLSHPETAGILASVRLGSDGGTFPAETVTFGVVLKSFAGGAMTVQPIHTYYNDAEGRKYAQANGVPYPFEDDYYDAEEGAPRRLPIGPDTVCVGNVVTAGVQYPAPVIDCAKFADAPNVVLQVWTAADGTTEQVTEEYRP
ncbi:MAG: hypothetical protein JWO46_1919 [Nocardioidaceae bacterium]|nr:hypothetical protein [Nocardioidaceae bacterium]